MEAEQEESPGQSVEVQKEEDCIIFVYMQRRYHDEGKKRCVYSGMEFIASPGAYSITTGQGYNTN